MKYLFAFFSLVFALSLTACAPTQNTRAAGETIDDASITARVKTEIAQAAGLSEAVSINVDTYRGVVSLAGFVDNTEQAQTAQQAAQQVPGVVAIKNNLQVKSQQPQSQPR